MVVHNSGEDVMITHWYDIEKFMEESLVVGYLKESWQEGYEEGREDGERLGGYRYE